MINSVAIRIGHKGHGTGASFSSRDEVEIATAYGREIERALINSGRSVLWLPSGKKSYSEELIDSVNPIESIGLYLQLHVNSALGMSIENDHGIIFYDYRSKKGPNLASAFWKEISKEWPHHWLIQSSLGEGYPRVHPCIRAAKPIALLIEPWFIQVDRNPELYGRMIGAALSNAISTPF
jgi:hypothetical protein